MDAKRFTTATVAGAVTLFVAGYLLYGLALADFYAANVGSATGVEKDPPIWLYLVLGQLVFAAFVTLVLGWKGVSSAVAGMKAGAAVGFLVTLGFDLSMYSMANLANMTATLVDPLVALVHVAIGGAVIGWVLGRGRAG
jgi:hypothetical protein